MFFWFTSSTHAGCFTPTVLPTVVNHIPPVLCLSISLVIIVLHVYRYLANLLGVWLRDPTIAGRSPWLFEFPINGVNPEPDRATLDRELFVAVPPNPSRSPKSAGTRWYCCCPTATPPKATSDFTAAPNTRTSPLEASAPFPNEASDIHISSLWIVTHSCTTCLKPWMRTCSDLGSAYRTSRIARVYKKSCVSCHS